MGKRNYLIEGVSGTGKTSVCHELRRRGLHAINGDTDLAYQGDPETGEPITGEPSHWQHIWDVAAVRAFVADQSHPITFFCGGSRNFARFIGLFDAVFVLDIDVATLNRRLDERPADEFGAQPAERELILEIHRTRSGIPAGIRVDATAPLADVVEEILRPVPSFDGEPSEARASLHEVAFDSLRHLWLRAHDGLEGEPGGSHDRPQQARHR